MKRARPSFAETKENDNLPLYHVKTQRLIFFKCFLHKLTNEGSNLDEINGLKEKYLETGFIPENQTGKRFQSYITKNTFQ
jgi:hypothetical protein